MSKRIARTATHLSGKLSPAPPAFPLSRRAFLRATTGSLMLAATSPLFAQSASIIAVRVWPARDYTRVTLELEAALKYSHQLLANPHRLVLDIEDLELSGKLRDIVAKITANDPYIGSVRAGQFKPRVVRLVFDLKTEINPQVFALKPVGEYGHRLVLDLYPVNPPDPLLSLMDKQSLPADMVPRADEAGAAQTAPRSTAETRGRPDAGSETARAEARTAKPVITRMLTIALDPGHGGEDPGAVGRRGTYEKNVTLAVAKRLKEKIDAEPNMRTMLTRDSDYFVPLNVRVQKARKIEADLFVSIHAD